MVVDKICLCHTSIQLKMYFLLEWVWVFWAARDLPWPVHARLQGALCINLNWPALKPKIEFCMSSDVDFNLHSFKSRRSRHSDHHDESKSRWTTRWSSTALARDVSWWVLTETSSQPPRFNHHYHHHHHDHHHRVCTTFFWGWGRETLTLTTKKSARWSSKIIVSLMIIIIFVNVWVA